MKKKLLILFAFCFSLIFNVHAECGYKEQATLKQEAKSIKANFEEQIEMLPSDQGDVEGYYFKITLLNLSENFNVSVTNNIDNNRVIYTKDNLNNGMLAFDHKDLSQVTTYTFKVYASSKTNCSGDLIKTLYLNVPRYNRFSTWGFCSNNKSHLCDKYVLMDEMNIDEIRNELEKEEKTKTIDKETTKKENKGAFNDTLIIVIGSITILLVGGIVIVINKRKASL